MGRFENKVVIVTGSSNGIGQATLLDFAKEGANVVLHGLNQDRIKETENLLQKAGISASQYLVVKGPVQEEATVQALINEPLKKWGKIDILVNNAGLGFKSGHELYSIENFDYVFAVNVRARLRLIELAIPHLQKTKGNTVGVSSTGAFRKPIDHPLHTFYSTASAAFDHYMRNDTARLKNLQIDHPLHTFYSTASAAFDHYMRNDTARLASLGIRINNVNPGPTITGIFTHDGSNKTEVDAGLSVYEKLSRNAVLPGGAEPSEVSRIILFLADEQSKSITGASYYIDRGLSTYAPA
uniref:Uncharacterized protein n=1 Tax=Acrobeloides nanus TaxID=290746 RepID=A0A914D753_9BILA